MITFPKLGKMGRVGNQMFQIASTMGVGASNNKRVVFNGWEYAWMFKNPFPNNILEPDNDTFNYEIKEKGFHHTPIRINDDYDYWLNGYFQSYKYFEQIEPKIREQFQFRDDVKEYCQSLLPNNGRKNIAIHVRRTDYVGNKFHYNLSIRYYLNAIESLDWKNSNLVFFSDDIEYCRFYFGCLPNSYFIVNNEDYMHDTVGGHSIDFRPLYDLCTMTLCDHFIIANSSFSWWGSWLSQSPDKVIVRPQEHFYDDTDIKDLYPESWISVSDKAKPALLDTTFIIPVKYDHADRKSNLELSLKHLTDLFSTEISIVENMTAKYSFEYLEKQYDYAQYEGKEFHRTKMINSIAKFVRTPYIVNWDADMLLNPVQIWYSVQLLRTGTDIVYPYDGNWKNIGRHIQPLIQGDIDWLIGKVFNGPIESWGGAIFMNRAKFLSVGGENENFISWGPEDAERYVRFLKMGLSVVRVKGPIFHLEHYRGPDSGRCNPHLEANRKEWHSIRVMEPEDLKKYIDTWEWTKK